MPQFGDAKFYKYKPWNEFTKSTIRDNSIWFSSPSEVNDPYDCRFPDIPIPSDEQLTEYLKLQYINLRDPYRDRTRAHSGLLLLDSYIEAGISNQGTTNWEQLVEIAENKILGLSSFCSLSEVNNSPLMFAHYADSHRGVCLEFHFSLEYSLAHIEAVEYAKKFNVIDIFSGESCDDASLVQATMYRKSTDWAYEKEWRAFRLNQPKGLVNFDPRCLYGLILGCRMPKEERAEAIELAKSRSVPMAIYESVINSDGVSFDICPINV